MIVPESITVPSRSNRTTGNRMALMLARQRADPDRPWLDALDRQDRAHPGIVGEAFADIVLAPGVPDKERRPVIRIAERPAEDDRALFSQAVDERRVLIPAGLLAPRLVVVPRG